jgi:hypothetical protein
MRRAIIMVARYVRIKEIIKILRVHDPNYLSGSRCAIHKLQLRR